MKIEFKTSKISLRLIQTCTRGTTNEVDQAKKCGLNPPHINNKTADTIQIMVKKES